MEKLFWSSNDVYKLFFLKERNIDKRSLFYAEKTKEIPEAARVARGSGKILARQWNINQIPELGAHFGFLEKPKSQKIICVYTPKGGVLKTTFSFNFARTLALNGIKVLILGLDIIQGSITSYTIPSPKIESLEDLKNTQESLSLYHFFIEDANIKEVIKKTPLQTLDIIQETPELNILEKKLRLNTRREYLFKDKLMNNLSEYDVIIFDNSPSWNQLVENALTASSVIISPIGCDIETYKSIDKNLSTIFEFQKEMKICWDKFIQVPTLLEKNKLSQQIYGAYLQKYPDTTIPFSIRRSVTGQEARVFNRCVIEYEPTSPLAHDYYDVFREIWKRILCEDNSNVN